MLRLKLLRIFTVIFMTAGGAVTLYIIFFTLFTIYNRIIDLPWRSFTDYLFFQPVVTVLSVSVVTIVMVIFSIWSLLKLKYWWVVFLGALCTFALPFFWIWPRWVMGFELFGVKAIGLATGFITLILTLLLRSHFKRLKSNGRRA